MVSDTDYLHKLADVLDDFAALEVPAMEYDRSMVVNGDWIDPEGTPYWDAWRDICEIGRTAFAPLNYVRGPEAGMRDADDEDARRYLEFITVAPQDEPEIKLRARYWAVGELEIDANFANPTDGSWESLFRDEMTEYDEERAERIRDKILYVREAWTRADELADQTVLSLRESQVQALTECEYPRHRIAEILELEPGAVEALSGRIDERLEHAENTIDMLG